MRLPPDFPRRLRAARAAAGLSQSALALRAGLHAVAYGRIERGVDHPRAGTLRAICRALSASADALLELSYNPADGGKED
jgi:transcriptional regulator with XRE-family HTH domain